MEFEERIIDVGKADIAHGVEKSDGSIDIYISRNGKTYHKNFTVDDDLNITLNSSEKGTILSEVVPFSNGKKLNRLDDNLKID